MFCTCLRWVWVRSLWHKWDYIVYSWMSFFFLLLFLSLSPYRQFIFVYIFLHFSHSLLFSIFIFILSERNFHLRESSRELKIFTLPSNHLLLLLFALFFLFVWNIFYVVSELQKEAFLIAIFHFILPHLQFETRVKLVWGKFSLISCSLLLCFALTILLWGWKWASLRDVKKNVFFCLRGGNLYIFLQNKP